MEKHLTMATGLVAFIITWTELGEGLIVPPCDRHMFDSYVHDNCLPFFNKSMEITGYQDRCPWPTVKGTYNTLKYCVDRVANLSWCRGCGSMVDEIFLEVHERYFSECGQTQDPPLDTLIMLIAPCIITTLFLPLLCVHLTTYNTEMP